MPKFPVDADKRRVLRALATLGFEVVREREHIALQRANLDGTVTPMTIPNHPQIKASTLRTICRQAGIDRDDFLAAYEQSWWGRGDAAARSTLRAGSPARMLFD